MATEKKYKHFERTFLQNNKQVKIITYSVVG